MELFGGGAQRVAEFHELVEAGNYAVFGAEIYDGLIFGQPQTAQRVDEESGAAANLIAEQRDPSAGVVVSFDDDVLELIAKILLYGGLVLLFDFGIIGEDSDGAEVFSGAAFVGGEKFLHGIRGVGAVVEDLRQRGVSRANTGERIAESFGLLNGEFTLLAEIGGAGVKRHGFLAESLELAGSGFPIVGGTIRFIANADGRFQQLMFGGFALIERFGVMDKRFFGLLLLAVQAHKTLVGFRGGTAEHLDARFRFLNPRGTGLRANRNVVDADGQGERFFAHGGYGVLLRDAARCGFGGLGGGLGHFLRDMEVARRQFL